MDYRSRRSQSQWDPRKKRMMKEITAFSEIVGLQDFVVHLDSTENCAVFKVNSHVITGASNFFAVRLRNKEPTFVYELALPSKAFDGFLCLCWYLYYEEIITPSLPISLIQYHLAEKYQVKHLPEKLEKHLMTTEIPVSVLCDALLSSNSVHLESFKARVLRLIAEHLVEFLSLFGMSNSFHQPSRFIPAVAFYLPSTLENFFMEICIFPSSVCSMLEVAEAYGMERLSRKCLLLISGKTRDVLASKDFKDATQRVVRKILLLDRVTVSAEIELVLAVISWCFTKACQHWDRLRTLTDHIKSFTSYIRFLAMSEKELELILSLYPFLLSSRDWLSVFQAVQSENLNPLPQWLCGEKSRLYQNPSCVSKCMAFDFHLSECHDNPVTHTGKYRKMLLEDLKFNLKVKSVCCHVAVFGIHLTWIKDETYTEPERNLDLHIAVFHGSDLPVVETVELIRGCKTSLLVALSEPVLLKIDDSVDFRITVCNVKGYTFSFSKISQASTTVYNGCNPPFLITNRGPYTMCNLRASIVSALYFAV